MSQTIEQLITEKQEELGLSEEKLKLFKDYFSQLGKLIDSQSSLFDDPNVQKAISEQKMDSALKMTSKAVKVLGIGLDINKYVANGDSVSKAVVKSLVDVATSGFVDSLATLGFGKGAKIAESAINMGGVVVNFKTPGELSAADAVKWIDWSWDYYIGPNVTVDRTKADTLIITSQNGTTSQILHHNWDGGWESWFSSDKFLKDYENWTIVSGKNGDNETIELKNNTRLEFLGYTGGNDYHITYPFQSNIVNQSYDHLTEVLGYLAQKGIEHINVSLNGGSARAVTSFVGVK